MSTLRNLLANNPRVKEILQMRKTLGEAFPYTDWTKVPVKHYSKFLSLKDLIGECGVVWTNAFKRSNTEAEDTRKYLKDYSGNERDMELFNFGYSKQSGFNGYVQDFRNFVAGSEITNSTITESKIAITNTNISETNQSVGYITKANYINKGFRIKVSSLSSQATFVFYTPDYSTTVKYIGLKEGIIDIPALTDEEWSSFGLLSINLPKNGSVVFEQIPNYRGAIVSDGVDDYGQCVKDFALPDDYTVVAMREILNDAGCLISKSITNSGQAFILENIDTDGSKAAWSFGNFINVSTLPKLFSWLTKTSYNGNEFAPGTKKDSADLPLTVFLEGGNSRYMAAALYSFGVFNRTLTAEELSLVEDCMYLELEYNTNILDGIEYYDILDARYRSNEEAEDKRNKWNGRLGKLHMTLNNYGYSQMSGWNGMSGDFSKFSNNSDGVVVSKDQSKVTLRWNNDAWVGLIPYSYFPHNKVRLKVSFKGKLTDALIIFYDTQSSSTGKNITLHDGINEILEPDMFILPNWVYISSATKQPGDEITIELIPDYGGALVSDGVDDYAVSDEVIDEEIGGMVVMAKKISNPTTDYGYVFSSTQGPGTSEGSQIAGLVSKLHDNFILGDPWTLIVKNVYNIYTLSRSPKSPNNKLMINNSVSNELGNAALYQLRLIKSQPTDLQLEVIKHQVLMEHNDYIKEMGWN